MSKKRRLSTNVEMVEQLKKAREGHDNTELIATIFSKYRIFEKFFYDAYVEDLFRLSLLNKKMRNIMCELIKKPRISYSQILRKYPKIPDGRVIGAPKIKVHLTYKLSDFTMTTKAKVEERTRTPTYFGEIEPYEKVGVPLLLKIIKGEAELTEGRIEKIRLEVEPLLEWEVFPEVRTWFPDPWGSEAERFFNDIRKGDVVLFMNTQVLKDEKGKKRRWIKHAVIMTRLGYFNPLSGGRELKLNDDGTSFEGTDLKLSDMIID